MGRERPKGRAKQNIGRSAYAYLPPSSTYLGSCPIGGTVINKKGSDPALNERVQRAVERLSELEASGVGLYEILGGEAGTAFLREACHGDPDIAYTAFSFLHSPRSCGA